MINLRGVEVEKLNHPNRFFFLLLIILLLLFLDAQAQEYYYANTQTAKGYKSDLPVYIIKHGDTP